MFAKMELKGIDGKAHKKWNLRLNLTQREKLTRAREEKE